MVELSDHHKTILERYSRPIVHLRKQIQDRRFGLIFGAGISKSFGLPTWTQLVKMISKDSEVQGENILKIVPPRAGSPYITQMLFEHFKERRYKEANAKEHNTRLLDYRIGADWREIVRKYLYTGIQGSLGKALHTHPYIKQYLTLIQ